VRTIRLAFGKPFDDRRTAAQHIVLQLSAGRLEITFAQRKQNAFMILVRMLHVAPFAHQRDLSLCFFASW
jgi:hypothetical protein